MDIGPLLLEKMKSWKLYDDNNNYNGSGEQQLNFDQNISGVPLAKVS